MDDFSQYMNPPVEDSVLHLMVVGTRTFEDYALLKEKCDYFLQNYADVEIISGGCTGTDTLAKRYAMEKGFAYQEFPADWNVHGKKAGPIRNKQMCEYIQQFSHHGMIAFWDGNSPGTKNDITLAKKNKIPLRIITIDTR